MPEARVREESETSGHSPGPHQAQAARAGKIVVSATFTAEPIEEVLRFWMRELGLDYEIDFAPYNQVFQCLLDPGSKMRGNRDGNNLLLIRFEDWKSSKGTLSASAQDEILRNVEEFISALKTAVETTPATFIVCCCPPSHLLAANRECAQFLTSMQEMLSGEFEQSSTVHVITAAEIDQLYPVEEYEDQYANEAGHVPYTRHYFTALATITARRIWSLSQSQYKVVVLDCDNTLWRGICGEDGTSGVRVDSSYAVLQQFMRKQRDEGMLLCVCSKNNEEDVWDVFERNPGMLLKREEITGYRINWGPKSENLKSLAYELGVGLNSFIFVDDNPMECAEIAAECPEVLTLQVPEKTEQLPHLLKHVWAFDHFRSTDVDKRRGEFYKENRQREQLREGNSLDEFIASLQLEISLDPLSEPSVPRVAQLTQRTNQFNFTTVRRQEAEVYEVLKTGTSQCLTVTVRDRFGDYGLVGTAIYHYEERSAVVTTFLLSCRALGRRVEHVLLERIAAEAHSAGKQWVDLHFVYTGKNKPALEFLESIAGVDKQGAQLYRLNAGQIAEKGVPRLTLEVPRSLNEEAETHLLGSEAVAGPGIAKVSVLVRIATELADVFVIERAVDLQHRRRSGSLRKYIPPEGEFEEAIAEIWAALLRLERVGQLDDFFLSGGDSLLATQMMSRVSQRFGAQLPIAQIFNNPTLKHFAHAVATSLSAGDISAITPLSKVTRPAELPLSYGQQRLWFLEQWQPGGHVYNVPLVCRVRGELNLNALRRSIDAIVERHESLRTTFHLSDLQPLQRIHESVSVPLRSVDMKGCSEESEAMRVIAEELCRPFDLSSDVPVRFIVVQIQDECSLFGVVVHHIVADGWSLDILFRELTSFYDAFLQDRELCLEPLPIQFADYAVWQREYLNGAVLEDQLAYWRKQLEGASPQLRLPTDMPRPATQSFRGALLPFVFPREMAAIVAEMCRTEEVTSFIALLTVLQILLRQYSAQNDISIGSPIANRTSIETEGLIGFFANTLVLRTVFPRDPSFREMLAITRETALGAYSHQYMPLEKLVEVLKPARAGYNPLFQVNFRVLTSSPEPLRFGASTAERVAFDPGIARFDLALELFVTPERFEGFFEYSTDLFYPETIRRLQSHFEQTLRLVAKRPDMPLSSLGLDQLAGLVADRGPKVIRKRTAKLSGAAS